MTVKAIGEVGQFQTPIGPWNPIVPTAITAGIGYLVSKNKTRGAIIGGVIGLVISAIGMTILLTITGAEK